MPVPKFSLHVVLVLVLEDSGYPFFTIEIIATGITGRYVIAFIGA